MRRLALLSLLVALAPLPATCADGPGPTFGNPFHFTEVGGAAIYAGACAGCHMPDGRGAAGAAVYPALARDPRLVAAAYPIARVLHGKGAMPPFARTLSDEQVAAVVDYIRTNFGNADTPAPTAAEVAAAR